MQKQWLYKISSALLIVMLALVALPVTTHKLNTFFYSTLPARI